MSNGTESDSRVLILSPTRRDGDVTIRLLSMVGLHCVLCPSPEILAAEIAQGAGAVLLTEQVVKAQYADSVIQILHKQPPWSDLPIVMLVPGGPPSLNVKRFLTLLSNVTVLERPAAPSTVISAVQAALRARLRQYQIRELLEKEGEAREEGERTNRAKDEFLATLSHELRTPLNAIFGWAQILKLNPRDVRLVSQAVEVIDRNIRMQTQMIEDLLDMSRIISGKIRLEVHNISVAEVIDAALGSVTPAIQAREIRLEKLIDYHSCTISGDFGRLQQVFWNLLTNAVKFTPKGGRIHIVCERVDSHVEISITDTGEGIDPDFLPHLFERFSQADGSTTRQHGGLGLGLSIVKYLIELHGGTVVADSAGKGRGATFLVRLPLRMTKPQDDTARPVDPCITAPELAGEFHKLRGMKVLVIDDEPDAREVLRRFLETYQAIPQLADSTMRAEEILAEFCPDVIVSDIGMPGDDGIAFMRRYRDRGMKTPAIALTAFARADDRIRSLQAGYQSHLSKPVEPAELLNVIIRLHEN
jgi:signal transduction histidine kinase